MHEELCPLNKVSKEEIREWFKPWKKALVIKLVGKNLGPHIVLQQVKYLWRVKRELLPTDIGNGYIVIRFTNDLDYETALFGGPWLKSYHYVVVQKYTSFFDPDTNIVFRMPVWIRVPRLPPYFFNKQFLARIGNRMGKTLMIDETTLTSVRGQFARVSVEVDLSKLLVSKFRFGRSIKKIEYEGLHTVCFSCGKYGHKQEKCPDLSMTNAEGESATRNEDKAGQRRISVEEERPELFSDFGAWMIAKRPVRRRKNAPQETPATGNGQKPSMENTTTQKESLNKGKSRGSRFAVIAEMEEDNSPRDSGNKNNEGLSTKGSSGSHLPKESDNAQARQLPGVSDSRKKGRQVIHANKLVGVDLSNKEGGKSNISSKGSCESNKSQMDNGNNNSKVGQAKSAGIPNNSTKSKSNVAVSTTMHVEQRDHAITQSSGLVNLARMASKDALSSSTAQAP